MGVFHFTIFKYIFVYKSVSVCEVWLNYLKHNKSVSDWDDFRISSANIFCIGQN